MNSQAEFQVASGKLFISIFMGLEPFPHGDDKFELVYNMRSSFRPTDLVLLSSTIVRGSC